MKKSNVAIFVPHNGCPHQCSFCNQCEITGQQYQPTAKDVISAVNIAMQSVGTDTANSEIAFFGGSFTAIDRGYMTELLQAAYPYVKSGRFKGIRLSTRPDCIDDSVLEILKSYGVTAIELGAQSMTDSVLNDNKRGHTADDVVKASYLIKSYGFSLGLQMMTGLFGSNDEKDIYTARQLISLAPDTVRIYPTIVMHNTPLEQLFLNGDYLPPTLENAVNLCAKLLCLFQQHNIKVIRLGLHSSQSMQEGYVAGPWHPAFAELCSSKIFYDKFLAVAAKENLHGKIIVNVNPKDVSKFIGQKKCNLQMLKKKGYNITLVAPKESVKENELVIDIIQ